MASLSFEQVGFTYPQSTSPVLSHVDFTLEAGSFTVVCGPTGSGKSTLLRLMKPELSPVGKLDGQRLLDGVRLDNLASPVSAAKLGYVMQNPATQMVTDTVWHELAFGLENLGIDSAEMRRRIGETAQFFGIQTWFNRRTNELSGGQKQMLTLAAIMAMQPDVLILDEPTSQLDPLAAREFINALTRVNQELGCSVVIAEHRLDGVLPLADRVLFVDEGTVRFAGTRQEFARFVHHERAEAKLYLPIATQMGLDLASTSPMQKANSGETYAFTTKEIRAHLDKILSNDTENAHQAQEQLKKVVSADRPSASSLPLALEARDLYFRYDKQSDLVLSGLSLTVEQKSITCIVGGNASGKSTLLALLAGGLKPLRGRVRVKDKARVGLLVQNPQAMFVSDTLLGDLREVTDGSAADDKRIEELLAEFGLSQHFSTHPFDLSGGELQKAALIKLLLLDPSIIMLDEPTKGLDAPSKHACGQLIRRLKALGKTIVIVSHDLDFVAEYGDVCSLLFNGEIISSSPARAFFQRNAFYTTKTYQATRGIIDDCIVYPDFEVFARALNESDTKQADADA